MMESVVGITLVCCVRANGCRPLKCANMCGREMEQGHHTNAATPKFLISKGCGSLCNLRAKVLVSLLLNGSLRLGCRKKQ